MNAAQRGDFATALKDVSLPLLTQNNLGHMYQNGKGVPQDHAEAFKWYRLAADQGDVTEMMCRAKKHPMT